MFCGNMPMQIDNKERSAKLFDFDSFRTISSALMPVAHRWRFHFDTTTTRAATIRSRWRARTWRSTARCTALKMWKRAYLAGICFCVLRHKNPDRLIDAADHVLKAWRSYTDEDAFILRRRTASRTTPSRRLRAVDGVYELDLCAAQQYYDGKVSARRIPPARRISSHQEREHRPH